MKVLVLTFSFRPLNNPRAFRWNAITEELVRRGHEVHVVTSLVPGEIEAEHAGLLTIYRTGWSFVEGLRARIRKRRATMGSKQADVDSAGESLFGLFRNLLFGTASRLWRSLFWPDASCLWYYPARSTALALTARHNYDVMVSVAPPFTGVVVGRSVKARYPGLRWVLDLGDPFSFLEGAPPNNSWIYAGLNRRYERAAFADAAEISVTNVQTRHRYEEIFPESRGKVHVIPPLLSLPGSPEGITQISGKLVFVGTLYRVIREPGYLLELFARSIYNGLPVQTELHLLGDVSSCIDLIQPYQAQLGPRLKIHGQVSREEVAVAIAEAEVLINIGNDTTYQLPSKVVEYAASGKRILNLAKTSQDSSVLFFSDYPQALSVIAGEDAPNENEVRRFVTFVSSRSDTVRESDLAARLAPYQSPQVVAEYLQLFGTDPCNPIKTSPL